MADQDINITLNTLFFDGRSASIRVPLPVRRACPDIPPPFVFPGDEWNCNLCAGDASFCIPWNAGDVIPVSFAFPDDFNADPLFPVSGWTDATSNGYISLTVFDDQCVPVIQGVHNVAENYYVTWCAETKTSNQVAFIDTRLLPLDLTCFKIGISVINLQGEEIFCIISNDFCKNECPDDGTVSKSNTDTVLIESAYTRKDCFLRCYGTPDTSNTVGVGDFSAFYNSIRVPAVFNFIGAGPKVTETTDAGFVLSTQTSKIYRLESVALPPYMACWLALVLESDNEVTINGHTFTGDNISVTTTPDSGTRMLTVSADFVLTCDIENTICD